jgi:hypothetical protein
MAYRAAKDHRPAPITSQARVTDDGSIMPAMDYHDNHKPVFRLMRDSIAR